MATTTILVCSGDYDAKRYREALLDADEALGGLVWDYREGEVRPRRDADDEDVDVADIDWEACTPARMVGLGLAADHAYSQSSGGMSNGWQLEKRLPEAAAACVRAAGEACEAAGLAGWIDSLRA